MERLLFFWDNLDDLAGAAALLAGSFARLRLFGLTLLALLGAVMFTAEAYLPVLGLAFATLLSIRLLYYRVTTPPIRGAAAG